MEGHGSSRPQEASTQAHSWQMVANCCASTHTHCYSALKDIVDNPREAFASNIRLALYESSHVQSTHLVMSDDGVGFRDRAHLRESYDLGKSSGEGKGEQSNYGQGEQAAGLKAADSIIKMTEWTDQGVRMVVMLSQSMQQGESDPDDYKQSRVLRPLVEFQRGCGGSGGWVCLEHDARDLDLILKYSVWRTEDEIMSCFDRLSSEGYRTHLVMQSLSSEMVIAGNDIQFNDVNQPKSWPAKHSLRELLSLCYPSLPDAQGFGGHYLTKSGKPITQPVRITLFGEPVVPANLTHNSHIWKSAVVDLKPESTTTVCGQTIQNVTRFGMRVGFVFDPAEYARKKQVANTAFVEGAGSLTQGMMVVSKGCVVGMPQPVPLGRGGSAVRGQFGRGGFRSGIGALAVVDAPLDVKPSISKTEFKASEFIASRDTLQGIVKQVCTLLYQDSGALQSEQTPRDQASIPPRPRRVQCKPDFLEEIECEEPWSTLQRSSTPRRSSKLRRARSEPKQLSEPEDFEEEIECEELQTRTRKQPGPEPPMRKGPVLLAKLSTYPYWPCTECFDGEALPHSAAKGKVWVRFFGEEVESSLGEVSTMQITSCRDLNAMLPPKGYEKKFKRAVAEAKQYNQLPQAALAGVEPSPGVECRDSAPSLPPLSLKPQRIGSRCNHAPVDQQLGTPTPGPVGAAAADTVQVGATLTTLELAKAILSQLAGPSLGSHVECLRTACENYVAIESSPETACAEHQQHALPKHCTRHPGCTRGHRHPGHCNIVQSKQRGGAVRARAVETAVPHVKRKRVEISTAGSSVEEGMLIKDRRSGTLFRVVETYHWDKKTNPKNRATYGYKSGKYVRLERVDPGSQEEQEMSLPPGMVAEDPQELDEHVDAIWDHYTPAEEGTGEIDDRCTICQEPMDDTQELVTLTECWHKFHKHCMQQQQKHQQGDSKCPNCRERFSWRKVLGMKRR